MTSPHRAMADEEDDFMGEEEGEEGAVATATASSSGQRGRHRLFSKELRCMMYGFGDDQNPYTECVDLLEDLLTEFITETTHRAIAVGRPGRLQVEDLVFLVRKDERKFSRMKELLTMNEELKKARKAFDEATYGT
ncbi:transcription initiation factor TFIID subunit 13 [Petromyzon marinus]|uniref:Transcription initiation factor TFIID subunit 13 n=1 Tax=Petromyzon marinus TaxID=7757 RepID=A0AAJ7XI70_PETMA|nr:transcription initiation factor TFIID subunit 13 [Petromyzon marinus]XP_061403871.1 transcription initiation factor TFIID subunit 13-like [Lethenteron reissneri]XP_061403887.1 transcription initiation factor TFIID subunit 13-like [Lethenteron reissneri]